MMMSLIKLGLNHINIRFDLPGGICQHTYLRYHAVFCVIWHQFASIRELAEDVLQRFSLWGTILSRAQGR